MIRLLASRLIASLVVALLLTACGSDDSDAETDAANADAGVADTGSDLDATLPDADPPEEDASATDSGDEGDSGNRMDATNDAETDAADAANSGGCAPGYTSPGGVDGVIVACEGAAETLNQCDAQQACATGWHVCTASEFRAQYQDEEPPGVLDNTFWLASCIRDGAGPQSPSDQACSDCTGTATGAEVDVAFSCVNSIRIVSSQEYVGVRAAGSCQFAGTGDPGNDAYWSAAPASTEQAGAFCCPD